MASETLPAPPVLRLLLHLLSTSGSDAPNYAAFSYLGLMIERMFKTKKAPYPVERTLLVTGALDALMTSHAEGERRIETPHLASISVCSSLRFDASAEARFDGCLRCDFARGGD